MANILLHACATGAALLLALAAVLWLHERGAFDAMARFLPHSACERILLAVVAVGFIHYGATKETNGVRGVSAPMRSAPSAPRVLTQGEIDAGYALVGVGTDETFDFSPPPGAAVAERWRRRGAAHDKLQIAPEGWFFPSGDVTVTNLTVRSEGRARLPNGIEVAPLPAVHGIVPEMNWPRLAESDRPSLFWHALSGDGSLVLTWQNVLLHRAVTNPVSFQAELKPSGSVTFRYDISRLGSDDVLAGVAPFLGNAAAAPLSRDVTSITFGHRKESVCDESRSEFEAKFGGLDPFAFPEGSTNTFFEHVFYSGTTNGAFSFPHDTNDTAVLRVAVSGTGSGDLLVGDAYVPLLTPPMRGTKGGTRTSGGPARPEMLVSVPKGRTLPLYLRADGTLSVSFDSQSFAFGELPDAAAHRFAGWVNFPDTRATEPCIHDFSRNSKGVTLPASGGADGLACTWRGGDGVEVENVPPRSATLTATFDPGGTGLITYTLSHPAYLFGAAEYSQTVRHCPSVDESEPPFDRDPWIDGDDYDSCRCHGDCPDDPPESSEDEFDGYDDASTNAVEFLARVLYMRDPPETGDTAWLEVPTGYVACCQCSDHWTNHVGVAYKSGRLEVRDASGREFWSSAESCAVGVAGIHPSEAVGDAELAFESNGELIMRRGYTVLGVGIRREGVPLSRYNDLSDTFGFPMTVCTNVWDAPEMRLVTNVGLPFGRVRIELEDAAGRFAVWRRNGGGWLRLAGGGEPAADIPIATWRAMIDGSGDNGELPVRITASAPGPARLVFRYWAVIDGAFVEDAAAQRITAVDPLLLADYNRDGVLDDIDIARYMAGRYACFWRNDDRWKDDNAFDLPLFNDVNSSDDVVNGRNDLINFLPIAVDVSPFESHWSSGSVYYRLEAYSPALRNAKLAFAEIARTKIGDAPLGNDGDIYGNSLHEAPVFALGGGTNLPPAFVSLSQSGRSTVLMEFPEVARRQDLHLNIYSKSDDALLFSAPLRLHVGDVSQMVGWLNLRNAAGGSGGVPTNLDTCDWPAEEQEPGNVVFVHGYNMHEGEETRLWAQNVFKKLWWAGLDRGFIAVQWRGNEGQIPLDLPSVGYVTPNYYGNVQNAFATASALKSAMDGITGPKWFMAHSLGNMLVSAAIQDCGMPHEKYFMLNAAVAMEAYAPSGGITQESHDKMTPAEWTNYTDRVRSTHWFERFPQGDGRRLLTWKGRFANVTNIVNFYSSQEEVVNDGDGDWHTILDRNYVWYNQETRKGLWPMMIHEYEGGWEFNPYHDTVTGSWMGNEYVESRQKMSPQNAANLTDEQLQGHPFFLDFVNPEMHTSSNGLIVATNYLYRAEMLAYTIPSESFAVGANPLPGLVPMMTNSPPEELYYNHDMAILFTSGRDDLPENHTTDTKKMHRNWQHSTFVQRSYKRVHQLYEEMVKHIKESRHE